MELSLIHIFQILPEKYHGITDTDMRYRQRYVDLIMNEDLKNTFIKRSQIIKEIRNFLAGRDFMEVETPTLVSNAGGAAARPFETHYNALNEDVKLSISLELYLKKMCIRDRVVALSGETVPGSEGTGEEDQKTADAARV